MNLLREREVGETPLFTSPAGLKGNLRQACDKAAKVTAMELTRIMALDWARKIFASKLSTRFARKGMVASIPDKKEDNFGRLKFHSVKLRAELLAKLSVVIKAPATRELNGQTYCVRSNGLPLFGQSLDSISLHFSPSGSRAQKQRRIQ